MARAAAVARDAVTAATKSRRAENGQARGEATPKAAVAVEIRVAATSQNRVVEPNVAQVAGNNAEAGSHTGGYAPSV